MPVELGYFTLKVGDIARAQQFYGSLFGWEFDGGANGAHVKNTRLPIGLSQGGPVSAPFLYFRVDNIDAAAMQLEELGGKVRERTQSPAGSMALCVDDQGTEFSLWQPAPGFG